MPFFTKFLFSRYPFLKSLSAFTGSNLLNASIPFLLLPLLTRYLSPADYGMAAMFQVLLAFTLPLTGLNVEGAVARQYFERHHIRFPNYVSNALYIVLAGTLIAGLLFLCFGRMVETLTYFPYAWLFFVLACSASQNISEILLASWQVQGKAMQYGMFRVGRTLVDVGLSVLLVIALKKSWQGRVEGQVIASILFALLAIYFLKRNHLLERKYNPEYTRNALRFGAPLIPHVLGATIMAMSDRIFISNMVGMKETGLYSAGYQIGMIIALIQNSFNQAWVPYFYEKLKSGNHSTNRRIVKYTYVYFILLLLLVFLLTLVSPLIFHVFLGEEYASAIVYVFWIALGFAFNGMYKMVVNYFFYIEKTYLVSVMTFTAAGLNIALNYFLIKINGALGAAQATTISLLVQFLIVWYFSAKRYSMPWLDVFKKEKAKS